MRIGRWIGAFWTKLQLVYYRKLGRSRLCRCGHKAKKRTFLRGPGYEGVYILHGNPPDYCPECFVGAAIRCAQCGEPIMPSDSITLYFYGDDELPDYAVMYSEKPHRRAVGCRRRGCLDLPHDKHGVWIMPGKVERVLSVEEQLTGAYDIPIRV